MFRKLMSRLLSAEMEPSVAWEEIESLKIEARVLTEAPRLFRRPEPLEQVLCTFADRYILFKKWHGSGWLMRLDFPRALDGREMRITEWLPGTPPAYRLQLWPIGTAAVT